MSSDAGGRSLKREKILEEEQYTDALQTIIERDFFPHLDFYRWKLAYLEAQEAGDFARVRELQTQFVAQKGRFGARPRTDRRGTGITPTPGRFGATPGEFLQTPATLRPTTPSVAGEAINDAASVVADEEGVFISPKLSLDAFLSKYTSEDNASFQILLKKSNDRKRAKNQHIYALETKQLPPPDAPLLLEGAKNKASTGSASAENGAEPSSSSSSSVSKELALAPAPINPQPGDIQMWNYTARNTLYYIPDGVGSDADVVGPPKEVLHANTRVSTLALGEAKPAAQGPSGQQQEIIWRPLDSGGPQSLEQWRRMRQTGQKYDLDEIMNGPGAKKPSGATTQDGGSYSFIATPDIRPGVDASPLMTWGNIESTPLLLDPSETPFHSLSGPSFKFPEKLSREVAAEQMHEEVSRKAKQKAADARAQPTARMASPRIALSPAAQRLAAKHLKSSGTHGVDKQLRQSYSPSPSRASIATPAGSIRATPRPPVPLFGGSKTGSGTTPTIQPGQTRSQTADHLDNLLNF